MSAETLAAIDRGIADADGNRTVGIEEVRQLIPQWISKFESQKPRVLAFASWSTLLS